MFFLHHIMFIFALIFAFARASPLAGSSSTNTTTVSTSVTMTPRAALPSTTTPDCNTHVQFCTREGDPLYGTVVFQAKAGLVNPYLDIWYSESTSLYSFCTAMFYKQVDTWLATAPIIPVSTATASTSVESLGLKTVTSTILSLTTVAVSYSFYPLC